MSVVLVLGAGATLAEALRTRGGQKQMLPPLDKGFFSAMSRAGIDPEDFEVVAQFMADSHGIDCLNRSWDSVESVMVRIASDCAMFEGDPERQSTALVAFTALLRLYNRGLYQTTSGLTPTRYSYTYRAITRWLLDGLAPSEVTVVTFNHDLEVEKVLAEIDSVARYQNRFGNLLALPYTYGRSIGELKRYSPGNVKRFNAPKKEPNSYLRVLKLHGSLNWHSLHVDEQPTYSDLLSSERSVRWTSRMKLPPALTARVEGQRRHTFPLVIPPVYNKASVMPSVMTGVWDEALDDLRRASEVVFFGYSCPTADTEAESLFRRALRSSQDCERVDIVNPDVSVVSRFADFAKGIPLRYFESADQWAQSGLP